MRTRNCNWISPAEFSVLVALPQDSGPVPPGAGADRVGEVLKPVAVHDTAAGGCTLW